MELRTSRLVLLLLLIGVPLYSPEAAQKVGSRVLCLKALLDPTNTIAGKIGLTHEKKGTFEGLHPIDPGSIAVQFPNQYARIMRLFGDRPSHLMGINRGLPPFPGMAMGQIFRNIRLYANTIGEDLGYIVDSFPVGYYARPILYDYVARFQGPETNLEKRQEVFDPNNADHLGEITRYGKSVVCSLWAELRLSLRIGQLSRVNVTVKTLLAGGVITNRGNYLDPYLDQEIDHFWYPTRQGSVRPYAVAIGETKVFDLPFTSDYSGKKKVLDQFRRYLDIASVIGAHVGLPPQIYYFFVAGISQGQIDRMQRMTSEFNLSIKDLTPGIRAPVELLVFGN